MAVIHQVGQAYSPQTQCYLRWQSAVEVTISIPRLAIVSGRWLYMSFSPLLSSVSLSEVGVLVVSSCPVSETDTTQLWRERLLLHLDYRSYCVDCGFNHHQQTHLNKTDVSDQGDCCSEFSVRSSQRGMTAVKHEVPQNKKPAHRTVETKLDKIRLKHKLGLYQIV